MEYNQQNKETEQFFSSTPEEQEKKLNQIFNPYDYFFDLINEETLDSKAEGSIELVKNLDTDEEKKEFIDNATERTMRCFELLEKSFEISSKVCESKNKKGNEEEKLLKDQTILFEDLVIQTDELEDIATKYVGSGLTKKCHRVSDKLMENAEIPDIDDQPMSDEFNKIIDDSCDEEKFQSMYMDMFTNAFGEELNKFRQESSFEAKDVQVLIDSIRAGTDVFTPLEKKMFIDSKSKKMQ